MPLPLDTTIPAPTFSPPTPSPLPDGSAAGSVGSHPFSLNSILPLHNTTGSLPNSFPSLLTFIANNLLSLVLLLAGIIAVFSLIRAGLIYITSGGSAERAKEGRASVINAVIGIIVITLSFSIVRLAVGMGYLVGSWGT